MLIKYVLRVLPTENVVEDFIKTGPGQWDERNKVMCKYHWLVAESNKAKKALSP